MGFSLRRGGHLHFGQKVTCTKIKPALYAWYWNTDCWWDVVRLFLHRQQLACGRFQGFARSSRIPVVFITTCPAAAAAAVGILVEVEFHGIQAQDLVSLLLQFFLPVFNHVGHRHAATVLTGKHFHWKKLSDLLKVWVCVKSWPVKETISNYRRCILRNTATDHSFGILKIKLKKNRAVIGSQILSTN